MTLLDLIRERMLQCGHGHEAVENGTGCEIVICDVALQCGHGHEAVENRSRCKRCISRWLERVVRAPGEAEGQKKQVKQCLIR